ncbi:hypothetical protein ET475_07910 [Microbacterium protaetiae]|uniref:Uncharacterized protein n=1 Tax=Microbacterium protaetiae TaxID=2509458 RepID=A0A4P6EID7_9MICO|nr:MaoC/PaaZ C-terminal domain-containing protein [Microbacterium protaetiae]QAY59927.1 hypothetical protein ET475_07910 [Microbacterium protaetiae]
MSTAVTDLKFGQIPDLVGTRLQGEWFRVADDRREMFDTATYTDENVRTFVPSIYPDQLIEGFHLVGMLDHLTNQILRTDGHSTTGWNYGINRVRFITPVTANDRIRLNLTVQDVRPKGDGYVLTFDCVIDHSASERPAFTAEWLVYWLPARGQ